MLKKLVGSAVLAAAIAAGGMVAATEAEAGVDINIGIGDPVLVEPYPVYPGWRHRIYYANRRVTCGQGAVIVRASGFHAVRPLNCGGKNYRYVGREGRRAYEVFMRAWNGRIYQIRPF